MTTATMTPKRWSQIYAAFSAVLEREPPQRAAYLAAFTEDPALREEVIQLLRDSEAAESLGFLQESSWVIDDIPYYLPDFKDGNSTYSQIEYVGHGGMGVVYKAFNHGLEKWVALKLCAPAHLGTERDRDRFRREAQNMARLNHPNIVVVRSPTGEYEEGRPYFEMDLIEAREGRSLQDRLDEYIEQPQRAAELIEAVALAVHHAHQRGILHNDLKPGNILLDEEGVPHVTDFGLARRVGDELTASATRAIDGAADDADNRRRSILTTRTATGAIEGTASSMSPEQAEGAEITTLSDVYGLGAVLYALLTGKAPFSGGTVQETLERVKTTPPEPPKALNPKVDRTLAAICLKCLQKDPSKRYASANALAQDVIRHRTGREIGPLPWSRRERISAWVRRNMIETGLVMAVIAIWVFTIVMAWNVADNLQKQLLESAMAHAKSTATDLATAARLQLEKLSQPVEEAAHNSAWPKLMASRDVSAIDRILNDLCGKRPHEFATCFVTDQDGKMLGHAPPDPDLEIGKDFSYRNYYRGAKHLAGSDEAYISRIYKGTSTITFNEPERAGERFYKFVISAPLRDDQDRFLGVIVTSMITTASLGPVIPTDGRKAAIIGPRDIEDPTADPEPVNLPYCIFIHFAYKPGDEPVDFPYTEKIRPRLTLADDQYIDPVVGGRWIAGFAPIDNTEFQFVVQQRYDEVVIESSTLWSLALWSALASLVVVTILAMVFWRWMRDRRAEAR